MELQIIESLVNELYSQNPSGYQSAAAQLSEWHECSSIINIIEYSIEFLTTRTNERILFFAATSLRACIFNKWDDFNESLNEKLVLFLCDYIVNHQENRNNTSYTFILICLADLIVLNEDFPINEVFEYFPIDIQIEICSLYFEEKEKEFYLKLINKNWFPVPDVICEFVHNLLQNTDLSPQWIRLYHNFALGYGTFQPFIVYMPRLFEVAKDISLCETLIDHITNVLNKDMNEPDEYHFDIVNLSIELSSNLREEIQQHPDDFDLATKLILLWDGVLYLEDSNEYFLKPEYLQITLNLINEFTEVEKVLIESVELSNDIELWPDLMTTAMRFCDNFSADCPIAFFAVNVLEFVLAGLDYGVQLSEIHDKILIFYRSSKDLFNEYFVNPNMKSPSLLLIIGYLNSCKFHNKDVELPQEISEIYCSNFQEFNAPPLVQIYFATQFVKQFEEYASSFTEVFFQFFDDFPYECSKGFYLTVQTYPQLIDDSVIEHLAECMDIMPYNKLEYLIPTIIILIFKISNEQVSQIYTNIFQIIAHAFMEAMQLQNRQLLKNFLKQLINIMYNTSSVNDIFDQDTNSDEYKLFLSFGQQIFNYISSNLQGVWMDPEKHIQSFLFQFVCASFQMNFVSNPSIITNWLNEIIESSPYDFHLSLIYFFKNDMQLMPNVVQFIKSLDQSKSEFIHAILKLVFEFIPEWDDSYWEFIPPEIIFNEVLDSSRVLQNAAIMDMIGFTRNPKISPDFKAQILQTFIEGIATVYIFPSTKEQAELILCLSEALGIKLVVDSFSEHIPMSEEDQQILGGLLSSFLIPDENEEIIEPEETDELERAEAYKKVVKDLTDFLGEILKRKTLGP